MVAPAMGLGEPPLILKHAEIGALKQFGWQYDLGAGGRGLADQPGDQGDIGVAVGGERRLQRRHGD